MNDFHWLDMAERKETRYHILLKNEITSVEVQVAVKCSNNSGDSLT